MEGAGLLRYLRFGSMQPFRPTGPGEETVMIAEAYRKGKAPEAGCSKCRRSDMMAVTCGVCMFEDGTQRCQHYCRCDPGAQLETLGCCT